MRLYQGDFARETAYGTDPVTVAEGYAAAGASWVHVVDLDAARTGVPENREVVRAIAAATAGRLKVQAGGGVRDQASAEALLATGVERVVLGTAAVEYPELVKELAAHHQVAVGIDARGRQVGGAGMDRGVGRSTCSTCCTATRTPAWPPSSLPTSPGTARSTAPTSTGWPQCSRPPPST